MSSNKYSAGLVSKPFWFLEFKKTIKLLADGFTLDEIREKAVSENLYGADKEYRAKEIFNWVSARARVLDDELVGIFCRSDLNSQKAIALFAVMRCDALFFSFMHEVYREKLLLSVPNISDSDIIIFFRDKQCQDVSAAKWTEYTLKKLKSAYINYLFEASFITDKNCGNVITAPILDIDFEEYLKNKHYEAYMNAMTGVR